MDQAWLVDNDYALKLLTPEGNWNVERDSCNKLRESESVEISRQKSCETVGVIVGLRKSPWTRMPHPVLNKGGKEQLLHWGSLLGGLRRGYFNDPKKENKLIQLAVNSVYFGTKRY